VLRYTSRFGGALARAGDSDLDAVGMLQSFCDLYTEVLRNGRMCLCGMLAAEYHTLPNGLQESVMAFFDGNEVWLSEVLATGRDEGSLSFEGTPNEMARFVVGELEGAMLLARLHDDVERFQAAVDRLVGGLVEGRANAGGGRREHL
jgi:TetR/AcrR family transcriptional repressor of nem operon